MWCTDQEMRRKINKFLKKSWINDIPNQGWHKHGFDCNNPPNSDAFALFYMPLLRRYWTYPTVETLYKEQSLLKSVTCFFHPDKNRKPPSSARLNSLSFHLARPCPSALCYLQSQSVPVIPLKGTTPEATQVWETVQCWPASPPPSPPTSLPTQPATSVHTGDRASINQTRAHRLKTLWHISVF